MQPSLKPAPLLPVPVVFLGVDRDLARRLALCFAEIHWGDEYRIAPGFQWRQPGEWKSALPETGPGMAIVEITAEGSQTEAELIRGLRAYNSGLQLVLLSEDETDYFRIAQDFSIGNVLKKNRFDASVIRALSIRLLTGNIFGFDPYFPNGYTVGPLYRTYSGRVVVMDMIEETWADCLPYLNPEESASFRIFLQELLTNTFSYAIEGITPADRDSKLLQTGPVVDIAERRGIKISLAGDAEKIGFSVMDSMGSLSMLRVLQKLRRQSRIAGEKMPPGIWDESGRGMSMVYRYSRFIINILKGVRTETIFLQYNRPELNRYESIIITEVNPLSH